MPHVLPFFGLVLRDTESHHFLQQQSLTNRSSSSRESQYKNIVVFHQSFMLTQLTVMFNMHMRHLTILLLLCPSFCCHHILMYRWLNFGINGVQRRIVFVSKRRSPTQHEWRHIAVRFSHRISCFLSSASTEFASKIMHIWLSTVSKIDADSECQLEECVQSFNCLGIKWVAVVGI